MSQFEKISKKLARPKSFWWYGRSYAKSISLFNSAIEEFIKEITSSNISMNLNWHRLYQNPFLYIYKQIENYFSINKDPPKTRLLTSGEKIVAASQKLHKKIILAASKWLPVLLNQAGSGWNPIESTKYFLNSELF